MSLITFLKLIVLILAILKIQCNPYCDDELIIIKNSIGYYYSHAYHPFNPLTIRDDLNSLCAGIYAAYQLCLNKPWIINPYSPNTDNCLLGLRKSALLNDKYSKKVPTEGEIDSLADIAVQAWTDCDDIINIKAKDLKDISDECKNHINELNKKLTDFTDARILGKSGLEFIDPITLHLEKQKRICDFSVIAKPNIDQDDSCDTSSQWLSDLSEQLEIVIDKQDYSNYTKYFKIAYQSSVRASRICNKSVRNNFLD